MQAEKVSLKALFPSDAFPLKLSTSPSFSLHDFPCPTCTCLYSDGFFAFAMDCSYFLLMDVCSIAEMNHTLTDGMCLHVGN